jgi:dihydroflavonol-4-reductase
MRVLATGANGHLGANVVRALLKRGYQVVPFVRQGSDLRGLEGLGLEYVYGDVMDEAALVAAAEGCDAMIHMAAVFRFWKRDPAELIQPALVGTRNAFAAAKAAGIRRVVFTSSCWAVGVSNRPDKILTAKEWNEDARSPYAVAKTESERAAWRLAEQLGIDMIAICPSGLLGPYDYRMTPSTSLIASYVNGTTPIYAGGVNYADICEVAEVHAGAVEHGKPGERYLATGENLPVSRYGEIIERLTGTKPRTLPGGRTALQLVAVLSEFGSSFTRAEPLISRAVAGEVGGRYMYYDSTNTTREFGIPFSGAEQAIAACIRWLLHIGQIKPALAATLAGKFPPDPACGRKVGGA